MKIKHLKKWSIVLIHDKNIFKSKNNKLRPFLVLKSNEYFKEALCIKLSTKNTKHLPTLQIERVINKKIKLSYLWLSQIHTVKYSLIQYEAEKLNPEFRQKIIQLLIRFIKK